MLPLAFNDTSGQTPILIAGRLVEIRFLDCFEAAGGLKDHLPNGPDISKIKAVAADAVDADIAHHQHAELAFPFRFCAHQPRQHIHIAAVCFDDRQMLHLLENSQYQYMGGTVMGE